MPPDVVDSTCHIGQGIGWRVVFRIFASGGKKWIDLCVGGWSLRHICVHIRNLLEFHGYLCEIVRWSQTAETDQGHLDSLVTCQGIVPLSTIGRDSTGRVVSEMEPIVGDSCGHSLYSVEISGGKWTIQVIEDLSLDTIHVELIPSHVCVANVGDVDLHARIAEIHLTIAARTSLETSGAWSKVVEADVVNSDITDSRSYYTLAWSPIAVWNCLTDYCWISYLNWHWSELWNVKFCSSSFVLRTCYVVKNQIASLLGQQSAFSIFVEGEVWKSTHHAWVVLPRVFIITHEQTTTWVRSRSQLENS